MAEQNTLDQRNHSVNIIPTIEAVLKNAQVELKEIDQIAVAAGPGSYTGLRIGITTAKIMGALLGIKLVGVSTLEALAANMPADSLTVALLDARNDNFFAGVYVGASNAVIEDGHYALARLLELVQAYAAEHGIVQINFVGDFKESHEEIITENLAGNFTTIHFGKDEENLVDAAKIGTIALAGPQTEPAALLPRYLRKTQAEVEWENKTGTKSLKDDSKYVEEV